MIPLFPRSLTLVSSRRTLVETTRTTLNGLLLSNRDDVDGDGVELVIKKSANIRIREKWKAYPKTLQQIFRLRINIQLSTLALGEIERRNLRDILILPFSLFFLKLEGDSTDRTPLNTFHEMGRVAGNLSSIQSASHSHHCTQVRDPGNEAGSSYLIPQPFRRNNCNLITDSLVGLEIERELRIVPLDDDLGGLFDGLGTDATHACGCWASTGVLWWCK